MDHSTELLHEVYYLRKIGLKKQKRIPNKSRECEKIWNKTIQSHVSRTQVANQGATSEWGGPLTLKGMEKVSYLYGTYAKYLAQFH